MMKSSGTKQAAKKLISLETFESSVKGRDFSRAANEIETGWASAPAGRSSHIRTPRRRFSAAFAWLLAGCRLLREDSGSSLVEVALCISLVGLPLLVGTVELGSMMYGSIEVSNAAHAGSEYGMMSSTFAADSAGIISAAQGEATDFGAKLTVTPTVYFACSQAVGGTQYTTQTAANAACTGTLNHSLEFVQVSTSTSVTPPIRCPGLASSYTLVGMSVMEVEE
jgi:Flp pilus assembly protein TadG